MKPPAPPLRRCHTGFSLIEITITLGITVFALVAVLAALPVGLDVLKRASDRSAYSEITRTIASQASQLPFPLLQGYQNGGPYLFDVDGFPTTDPDVAIYQAAVSIETPNFPAAPANIEASLANVKITIRPTRGPQNGVTRNIYVAMSDR